MIDESHARSRIDPLFDKLAKKGLADGTNRDIQFRHDWLIDVLARTEQLAEEVASANPKRRLGNVALKRSFSERFINGADEDELEALAEKHGWHPSTPHARRARQTFDTYIKLTSEADGPTKDEFTGGFSFELEGSEQRDLSDTVIELYQQNRIHSGYAQQLLLLFGSKPAGTVSNDSLTRAYQLVTGRLRHDIVKNIQPDEAPLTRQGRQYVHLLVGATTKGRQEISDVVKREAFKDLDISTDEIERYVTAAIAHALEATYGGKAAIQPLADSDA